MNDEFTTTTRIKLRWLLPFRNYLTPSALWAAVTALAIAIGYVASAQHDLGRLKEESIHQEAQANLQSELLHKIDTQLAVMDAKVDTIANEVDRQREWREKIEDVAEAPPHARRPRK